MALLTKRGAGTPTTTGTTWATVTNAVDGTPPANPATYATWTSSTSGAVATIEITGYAFSATIGAGDTLTSVTVSVRHLVSNVARYSSITYQPFSGGSAIGSPVTATLTVAAHNDQSTFPVTLAQLRAGTFAVPVTATRAAVTQSGVWSVDHVDVTADYSPPGVARDLEARAATSTSATAPTFARSAALSGTARSATSAAAELSTVAAPAGEGFRVARALAATAATSTGARADLTATGSAAEGFRVARALTGRAGTSTGARADLTTSAPSIVTLAGRASTATGARGTARSTRPLAGRASAATGARATLLTAGPSVVSLVGATQTAASARGTARVARPLAGRAATASNARGTFSVALGVHLAGTADTATSAAGTLTVHLAQAPPGILATFRLTVAETLEGMPIATGQVLAMLRDLVAGVLEALDPDWIVHPLPVDAVVAPAFLLEWADPWTVPATHCFDDARLEVVCVVSRVEPAAAIETLELMVESALAAFNRAGIAHGTTSAPRPFDIGGVDHLAARIQVHQPVNIGA